MSAVDPDHPNYPGSEETTFMEISDESGDVYYEDKEKIGVAGLILIVLAVGLSVAAALFYAVYRCERTRKEREAVYKQNGLSVVVDDSGTAASSPTASASGNQMTDHSEHRRQVIEEGLLVQTWAPDNMINTQTQFTVEETKQDEDSAQSSSSAPASSSSCPICNKAFGEGDLVCHSYNQACRHVFHKTCMFKILEYQNRCPVCNETYLASQAQS